MKGIIMKNLFYRLSFLSISLLLSVSYGHAEEPAPTDLNAILQNVPAKCQTPDPDFKTQLYCSQTYFLMNGKPINPMIVKDFTPEMNEDDAKVVSINLLASSSSRYSYRKEDLKIEKEGEYFSVEVTWPQESLTPPEYFIYKVLGKTANGLFVLKAIEGGGGSGVWSHLLFVRIKEDKEYDHTFSLNRRRILIETLGRISLEDRIISTVTIDGNSLLIQKTEWLPPHGESEEEITLE